MTTQKIQQLIERENERREEDMLHQARQIITAISEEQEMIITHNDNIKALRTKLLSLKTVQLDSGVITG